MTSRPVEARWALVGKEAGDKRDYRILSSGPDPGDLTELVWAAIPGTPQFAGIPGQGGLPRATFVPGRDVHGRRWLTTAVMEATETRDFAGRPNVAIRSVSLPFTEVATGCAGYGALYAAVPPADRLPRPAEPLYLELPGKNTNAADALAATEAFDRAAGLAALMLCGEVVVTLADAPLLTLAKRLEELDCVTALLPYGMRAEIALASWHDGTRTDRFRLAYGPFGVRGRTMVASGEPVPPPTAKPARDYLRALGALRTEFGVERLVDYLAGYREPLEPGDAAQAAQILLALGDPGRVVDAARAGQASAELVAHTRRQAGDRLDQDSLDALEAYLLARGDSEEEALAGWTARTATLAARLVLTDIVKEGASPRARRLYALADRQGDAEVFLVALAERKTLDGTLVQGRSAAGLILGLTSAAPGELLGLRDRVLRQPQVGRWLLRRSLLAVGSGAWLKWLAWLNPADKTAPAWLRPYALVTADSAGIGMVEAEEQDDEDIALVARLAYHNDPSPQVTDTWWPLLLNLARRAPDLTDSARADLAAMAEEADRESVDLATGIRLDTALLYLDLPVRYFPSDGAAPRCLRYLGALWDLWSAPPSDGDVAMLAARLLKNVLPAPGSGAETTPGSLFSEAAVALLLAVVRDIRIPLDEVITDIIAGTVTAAPGLLNDPRLTADWWTRIERLRPALRDPKTRFRAAVQHPDADPVEIAVLWGKAAAVGEHREDLLVIARPWLTARSPAEISTTLRVVDGVLRLSGHDNDDYMPTIMRDLATDHLAATASRAYAVYETERIDEEMAFWRRMRRVISQYRTG